MGQQMDNFLTLLVRSAWDDYNGSGLLPRLSEVLQELKECNYSNLWKALWM